MINFNKKNFDLFSVHLEQTFYVLPKSRILQLWTVLLSELSKQQLWFLWRSTYKLYFTQYFMDLGTQTDLGRA